MWLISYLTLYIQYLLYCPAGSRHFKMFFWLNSIGDINTSKERLYLQKWMDGQHWTLKKSLKSRIWQCLYTAIQRKKIHHLGFMIILVTSNVVFAEGQEYFISPAMASERSQSPYQIPYSWRIYSYSCSFLIINCDVQVRVQIFIT